MVFSHTVRMALIIPLMADIPLMTLWLIVLYPHLD
jgi:hypothetical protein